MSYQPQASPAPFTAIGRPQPTAAPERQHLSVTNVHPLLTIAREHGVFLRREAVALGMSDRALQKARQHGEIVRVRHGAYTLPELWAPLDERGRHLVTARAVLRTCTGQVMTSHHTGCVVHGLDLWRVSLQQVHLTRLDGLTGRRLPDVTHHEGLWLSEDVTTKHGITVSVPVRAAVESASLVGVEQGLVTVDSGLRSGLFSQEDLVRQYQLMQSWPSCRSLQLVTRLADGRSESVGETRARYLFWVMGLPAPVLQYPVYDGATLLGIADFAWPEHGVLGEFDGQVKYLRHARPGEQPGDVVFREKQREDRIREVTGWRFFRLTWPMLADPRTTAARLRAVLQCAA